MKNIIIFGILMLMSIGFVSATYNWTQQNGSGNRTWMSVASSSDGSKVVAGINDNYIYTSNDYGVTWVQKNQKAISIASSANGSDLIGGDATNPVWSHNYGVNWSVIGLEDSGGTRGADISSNGSVMCVVTGWADECGCGGTICSVDYGNNWFITSPAGAWDIAISSDGSFWVATTDNYGDLGGTQYILKTSNYGTSWNITSAPSKSWREIDMSSDGSRIVAVVYGGFIWTSSDSGVSWSQQNGSGSRNWLSVASSSSGARLVAVVNGGYIYTSNNYGVSWTEETSAGNRSWRGVAISSDGTKISAVDYGGYIWTAELNEEVCEEDWVLDSRPSCDGVLSNYTISYTDQNACGSFDDLPVDNGSVVSCCVSLWVCDGYGSCQLGDQRFCTGASDNNECGFSYGGNLSEFTQSCSFCAESWQVQYSGSCSGQDKVKFYVDVNNCGTFAGLPADNGSSVSCDVSSGGGGSVVVPQSIIPSVTTTSSAESTSFFSNFINGIVDWFRHLFGG